MNKFSIPVNPVKAIASGAAHQGEKMTDQLLLDFSAKNFLFKHELAPWPSLQPTNGKGRFVSLLPKQLLNTVSANM